MGWVLGISREAVQAPVPSFPCWSSFTVPSLVSSDYSGAALPAEPLQITLTYPSSSVLLFFLPPNVARFASLSEVSAPEKSLNI